MSEGSRSVRSLLLSSVVPNCPRPVRRTLNFAARQCHYSRVTADLRNFHHLLTARSSSKHGRIATISYRDRPSFRVRNQQSPTTLGHTDGLLRRKQPGRRTHALLSPSLVGIEEHRNHSAVGSRRACGPHPPCEG